VVSPGEVRPGGVPRGDFLAAGSHSGWKKGASSPFPFDGAIPGAIWRAKRLVPIFDRGLAWRRTVGMLSMLVVGVLAALLGQAIMPSRGASGWLFGTVLGVGGAVLGGMLMSALVPADPASSDVQLPDLFGSVLGPFLTLTAYYVLRRGPVLASWRR
jgi:uncharacterized membrane protein YeaQ/YmgE (transglycosylase-associated protein family)